MNPPEQPQFNQPPPPMTQQPPFNGQEQPPFNQPQQSPFNEPQQPPFNNNQQQSPYNGPQQPPFAPQQSPINGTQQQPLFNSPQQPPSGNLQQSPFNGPQPGYPGFDQQQGFPPQQQGFDQQRPPDNVHEHPLNHIPLANLICSICQQNINNQPGYQCGQCPISLCMNCSNRVFYGQKKVTIHPHPLNLRLYDEWRCNICNNLYNKASIFSCPQCNFGVCASCYAPY